MLMNNAYQWENWKGFSHDTIISNKMKYYLRNLKIKWAYTHLSVSFSLFLTYIHTHAHSCSHRPTYNLYNIYPVIYNILCIIYIIIYSKYYKIYNVYLKYVCPDCMYICIFICIYKIKLLNIYNKYSVNIILFVIKLCL